MTPDIFVAIEQSAFGAAAKSAPWLYPIANVAHVVGAAMLFGAILVFDVLLLRRWAELARSISSVALPVAIAGFVLIAASAPVLFASEAATLVRNPVFLAKMALVVLALANVALFYRCGGVAGRRAIAHAVVSASAWLAIIVAGRFIAYV
jgi:hypothetical protein